MHVCDIRLDLRKPDWDRPPVRVMRGDADATVVRAHILDGGEPADLSHAQARFEAVKPDGTWVREEAAAKPGGVVEYVLPPQVSAVEGLIEGACFRLVRDGAVDSAGPFAIEVQPSIGGRTLEGDMALEDIGVVELGNVEIESMFNAKMAERTGLWQSR